MKNVTLQLFEYLLAAQNSVMSTIQDINDYPLHWFMDELLMCQDVELIHDKNGESVIKIYSPSNRQKKVENSVTLSKLLQLLQYDDANEKKNLMSVDELRSNLTSEIEAINRKIGDNHHESININEWQQLLLAVEQTNVSYQVAIDAQRNAYAVMESALEEYQVSLALNKCDLAVRLEEKHVYDWLADLIDNRDFPIEIIFGVGMLQMNHGEVTISHPLLTMKLEIVSNYIDNEIELRFGNRFLSVDNIFNYVLFYGAEVIQEIKSYVDELELNPFDQEQVGAVLQKIIKIIHPNGLFLPAHSLVDSATRHIPQILHSSVVFAKEKSVYHHVKKQKKIAIKQKLLTKYLTKKSPTDVLNSVVDPSFVTPQERTTNYYVPNANELLFPWASSGPVQQILNSLDNHNAVTVLENGSKNNHHLTVDFLTHLLATGKRVLVVGEDAQTLDSIQNDLPGSLMGMHTKLATNHASYKRLSTDFMQLVAKKENNDFTKKATDDIRNEIQLANVELGLLAEKIAESRELGSRNNYWHGQRYYPKVEQANDFELDDELNINSDDVIRYKRLRPYFTTLNMELLNYQFINVDKLTDCAEYNQMLALENTYWQQVYDNPGLEDVFDESTDINFIQFLHFELPRLMTEIALVDTEYGYSILLKALSGTETYSDMVEVLGQINCDLKTIDNLDNSAFSQEILIDKLNTMLGISDLDSTNENVKYGDNLWEYYQQKKEEMTTALRVANSILMFNIKSVELSKNFIGILADGLNNIPNLYNATKLHMSKIEFNQSWLTVRANFIDHYRSLVISDDIHPSCVNLYQALKNEAYEEFRNALDHVQKILRTRHNFIIFGEFIEKLEQVAPTFTKMMMSEELNDKTLITYFEEAMNTAKQNGILMGQNSVGESELLENGIDYLLDYLLQLQNDLIEHESWMNRHLPPADMIFEVRELLEGEHLLDEGLVEKVLPIFNGIFMPLDEIWLIKNYDPSLFDLVVFVDASKSNVIRVIELMHAHKAVLFGSEQDDCIEPLNLNTRDFERLAKMYGENFNDFGKKYLNNSLFNLLTNSAAWDAQIVLPRYALKLSVNELADDVESGIRDCDTLVENEIFEALIGKGYDVKCKIDVGNTTLDFLISGEGAALAINVLGDANLDREAVIAKIEQEIELRKKGLNIRTIQAAQFYLNSRKALTELYEHLEKLGISPKK